MTTLQEAIERARSTAMSQAAKARIPECGEFAAIAQDLDFVCTTLAQQGEPVCAGCGIPAGDVHMSTCQSGKWPSRVSNGDTAAPVAQQLAPVAWNHGCNALCTNIDLWINHCPHCGKPRPAAPAPQPTQTKQVLEKFDELQSAQQGDQPTQRQLDTAMRQWETWKAYALELQAKVVKYEGGSPMILNAATPAPQLNLADAWQQGYQKGIADERTSEENIGIAGFNAKVNPARQNPYGAPAPQAPFNEPDAAMWLTKNKLAQHDLLSAPQTAQDVPEVGFGNMPKIGCVQHDCDECKSRAAQPPTDDEILTIAHRKATKYTHAVAPGQVTYGFSVVHLLDFVRAILDEIPAQPVAQPNTQNQIVKDILEKP